MAITLGLTIGALVVGLVAAFMFRPNMDGQNMSPATLESFQVTTTDEGSVVPWVCGYVRMKTNLIWYGDLISQAIVQDAGSGGGEITTGYNYWLSLWKTICLGGGIYGDVSIEGLYVGDEAVELEDVTYVFNDGTQSTYPTDPGDDANAMKGVAHIWLERYFLGENVTFVPTFHFAMLCQSNAPLTNANLANGVNPAARIYDVLRAAGASVPDFVLSSFQTAANYWAGMGYGLNLNYSSQKEAREWISQIFTYVDGNLRKDGEDRWVLKAWTPDDVSVATLNKEDLIDFVLTRRSWSETYNDFRGNYTDKELAYTRRTVRVYNGANQRLLGYKRQRTIDLTAFIDADTASKRLAEIMRRESYPEAQITFSTFLQHEDDLQIGEVFTINNDEYGISDANFRIITRDINEVDSNLLDFTAVQMVESLWDDTYQVSGGGSWVQPTYKTLAPPTHQAIFEMPPLTYEMVGSLATHPHYLLLCSRAGQEDSFRVLASTDGSDYQNFHTCNVFSQYGILTDDYPNSIVTGAIDDAYGITYETDREDPVFSSIGRSGLFTSARMALIGRQELVAFQNVEYVGENTIRLTGIIRGLLNTHIGEFNEYDDIWVFHFVPGNNVKAFAAATTGYVKYLTGLGERRIEASEVSAISVSYVGKHSGFYDPYPIPEIYIKRVGGSNITVYFNTRSWYGNTGAGYTIPEEMEYRGDYGSEELGLGGTLEGNRIEYKIDSGAVQYTTVSYLTFTKSGGFTLYARMREYQDWVTCSIPASDGEYIFPEITS